MRLPLNLGNRSGLVTLTVVALLVPATTGLGQGFGHAEASLRPLGSRGLVDQIRAQNDFGVGSPMFAERNPQPAGPGFGAVRQTAMMQGSGGLAIPPLAGDAGPSGSAPPPEGPQVPSQPPPGSLQPVPIDGRPLPSPPAGDFQPVPRPQLSRDMATIGNCANISPPSGYSAGGLYDCQPAYSYQPWGTPVMPVSGNVPIYPPQTLPPGPFVPSPGFRPLFTLGQNPYNAQLGQGIIGQPKAYVPGQTIRNFLRYLTP